MFCFIFIFTVVMLLPRIEAVNATAIYSDINILRAGACVGALKVDPLLESLARLSAATCRTDWDIDGYTRITTTKDIKFEPGRCGLSFVRDQFASANITIIGCAVAVCETANTTICYTDEAAGDAKCGACVILEPSVTVTSTTSTASTSTSTTASPSRNDSCVRAKLKCGRENGIGQEEIFPFLDSCSLDAEGKISTCISPPDCECVVDVADRAVGFGGKCAPYVCPAVFGNVGTLRWCRSCGYDCGGFQKDCLAKSGFCDKVSACQRLDMCVGWRESNCPGGVCGELAAVTDAEITTTSVASIDRSADSVGYAIGLAIGMGCCVIGSVACFWAVKKSRGVIPAEDVRRPIDDNRVKEIIVRSRAEFAEEVL